MELSYLQCQMTLSSMSSLRVLDPGSLLMSSPFLLEISTLMAPRKYNYDTYFTEHYDNHNTILGPDGS